MNYEQNGELHEPVSFTIFLITTSPSNFYLSLYTSEDEQKTTPRMETLCQGLLCSVLLFTDLLVSKYRRCHAI